MSTAEAEFVAASYGAKEILGLRNLLMEINVKVVLPMTMYVDNQAAIRQIQNDASSSATKHVDVRLKFVKGWNAKGVIKPTYIKSIDMIADLLTKQMSTTRLSDLRAKLGIMQS